MIAKTSLKLSELEEMAQQLRLDALTMIHRRGAGHPGGSLSLAEIMAVLYFHHLRVDPNQPGWTERDRVVLSKGHASAIYYAALAHRGFFPFVDLEKWGHIGAHLQGHPDRLKTPGVDMTTGMLGHGLSIGVGLALAARMSGSEFRTYVLLGDGECDAGVVWEGAMAAGKYQLSNLLTIVDYNRVQLDGAVTEIMPLEPFADKWRAFNFAVLEIDGHDVQQIIQALEQAQNIEGKPTVIIANTVKGKGVSYMEHNAYWHGIVPNNAQYEQAMAEVQGASHDG